MSRQFKRAVSRWVRVTKQRQDLLLRNVLVVSLDQLRVRTPVDTGRARDSWRVSERDPTLEHDTRVTGTPAEQAAGSAATAAQYQKARNATWGTTYYVSNNVPYAKILEDGHSPQGKEMLRRTFYFLTMKFPQLVREAQSGIRR